MPTKIIRSNSHIKIRFKIPRGGLVRFDVEASSPVDTYVLDDEGLWEFYHKEWIESYFGGFNNRYEHHQEIKLPFRGWAYLVIKNPRSSSVAVHFELSG
jgi:hypothetical protein